MNKAVGNPTQPILEIDNLSISFFTRRGEVPADGPHERPVM